MQHLKNISPAGDMFYFHQIVQSTLQGTEPLHYHSYNEIRGSSIPKWIISLDFEYANLQKLTINLAESRM